MVARIWLSNFSLFKAQIGLIGDIHCDLLEESVDRRAQAGEGLHRAGEILALQGGLHQALDLGQGAGNGLLFGLFQQCGIGRTGDLRRERLVLLLLGANDVGGAAVGGEQVLAGFGAEERLHRLDAGQQAHEIVLAAQREHRVDHVVAHALLAHLDLQALGEEGHQIVGLEEIFERQADLVLDDDADDAERRAAQRKGIARAGRLLADRPEARPARRACRPAPRRSTPARWGSGRWVRPARSDRRSRRPPRRAASRRSA